MTARTWGKASRAALDTAHFLLQELMDLALQRTPYDLRIVYGWRSAEQQNALQKSGASKLVYPRSYHNTWPAQALDFNPIDPVTGQPDPNDWAKFRACVPKIKAAWSEVAAKYKLPPTVQLECGADWEKFPDGAHVQLNGLEGREQNGKLIRAGLVLAPPSTR